MKTLIAFAGVIALLAAYGVVDLLDRATEDRLTYRRWVADACTPNPGERVVATNEDGKLHCTIYSQIGYGLAPIVVSAAVAEIPL